MSSGEGDLKEVIPIPEEVRSMVMNLFVHLRKPLLLVILYGLFFTVAVKLLSIDQNVQVAVYTFLR